MKKRHLATFMCIILATLCGFSQTRSMKDLIGKWKQVGHLKNDDTVEFIFLNDTTFINKDVKGNFKNINKYHFDFSKEQIILTSIHKNRNRDDITLSLKFINENTLNYKVLRIGSYDNTKNIKNVGMMLTKVDSKDYSYLANPTILNLRGGWMHNSSTFVDFISDTLASIKDGSALPMLYNYTADFTKFPYWLDFKSLENGKIIQGLFTFPTDSTMLFATFPHHDRKGYFKALGRNFIYLKLDSAKKAFILKRKQAR